MIPLFYYVTCVCAASFGLLIVFLLFQRIGRMHVDHATAVHIAKAIHDGAMTFLKEEYKIITIVVTIIAILLGYFMSTLAALLFVSGALLSLITGFIGMQAATIANVRTTLAAKDKGETDAFLMAFFGGGVMGFAVASFGLAGVGTLFYFFAARPDFIQLLTSFSFGASLVAFFARIGGGIYTKSADVGADLVGKIEAGIPEDDPRNPAVIADNVGDCVGDTAGMGADIYESYVGAMVSSIILALGSSYSGMISYSSLPLMLAAFGLFSSAFGLISNVILKASPAAMLRNATYVAIIVFLALAYGYLYLTGMDTSLFYSIILGCLAGIAIGLITEYYTGKKPVRDIAESSKSGAATNIIYGLSVGMESTVLPVVLLAFTILIAYQCGGGLFGVGLD